MYSNKNTIKNLCIINLDQYTIAFGLFIYQIICFMLLYIESKYRR